MNDYISKYWSCYLSIGAIIVSLVSIMISSPRYTPINIDYLGVIAGVLSILVTILLGWQIWTVISIDNKINNSVESMKKNIVKELSKVEERANNIILYANTVSNARIDMIEKNYASAIFCAIQSSGIAKDMATDDMKETSIKFFLEIYEKHKDDKTIASMDKESIVTIIHTLNQLNDDRCIPILSFFSFNSGLNLNENSKYLIAINLWSFLLLSAISLYCLLQFLTFQNKRK